MFGGRIIEFRIQLISRWIKCCMRRCPINSMQDHTLIKHLSGQLYSPCCRAFQTRGDSLTVMSTEGFKVVDTILDDAWWVPGWIQWHNFHHEDPECHLFILDQLSKNIAIAKSFVKTLKLNDKCTNSAYFHSLLFA